MILSSIAIGIKRTLKYKRMLLTLYCASLIFGLIIVLPFRSLINQLVGNSVIGGSLAGRMDMDFMIELLTRNTPAINMLTGLMIGLSIVYWMFMIFLSGGVYSIFARNDRYSSKVFWSNGGAFFGRFVRLFAWSVPVLAIFYCAQFLETGVVRIFFGKDPHQYVTIWGGWIRVGLGYLGLVLYYVVFDYARIYVVMTDERNMRRALWKGITFTFRHFATTFGFALLLFLIGVFVLIAYHSISEILFAPNVLIIAALVILQQFYMVFRMTLRLTCYAGQLNIFGEVAAAVAAPDPTTSPDWGIEGATPFLDNTLRISSTKLSH